MPGTMLFTPFPTGVLYHALCMGCNAIRLSLLSDKNTRISDNLGRDLDHTGYFQFVSAHQADEAQTGSRR